MKKRVVVGLSGGVDSSVSAYLLLAAGYEVIGIYMRNWNDESVTIDNECPWIEDSNDALIVAQTLGIPFQTIDLSEQYKARIVDYMFAEYQAGRTPNPDVLCNREIKFDVFLKTALELGADYVATGHYCQKSVSEVDGKAMYDLIAGADKNKDQSYFLCQLSQEQLQYALFPIGHLQKSEVRRIAKEQGLITAEKKDSQGLCFVGKVKLPVFLQQQLAPKAGDIVEIAADAPLYQPSETAELSILTAGFAYTPAMGRVVGRHTGAHYFTIGQRRGLGAGGGSAEPLFVIGTDTGTNTLYVGCGQGHPGLYRRGLRVSPAEVHWIRPDKAMQLGEERDYMLRIRYRQALTPARLYCRAAGLYIVFEQPQRGVTPGQFAAWYEGEALIGSGVIGA